MADDFSDISSDNEEEALKEDDERRSFRNNPLTKEQFEAFFDPSGRLVNEHELRRIIFKVTKQHYNGSLFANVTPKFKVVSNRSVDMVDNIMKQSSEKSDQNDCPYCHFDEDSTPDIVLPSVSFGEEQLKFMEIQAQVELKKIFAKTSGNFCLNFTLSTPPPEREVLKVEQVFRYEAMKVRWKKLLKGLVNEYEGVRYCPKWYTACPENVKEFTETMPVKTAKMSVCTMEEAELIETVTKIMFMQPRVIIPKHSDHSAETEIRGNNIMELKPFGLVAVNNPEEELISAEKLCVNEPSSYDEKLAQVHLLSAQSYDVQQHEVELQSLKKQTLIDNVKSFEGEEASTCNDTDKTRTASLNFECPDVNDLTEALADAMLDVACPVTKTNDSDEEDEALLLHSQPEEFSLIFPSGDQQLVTEEMLTPSQSTNIQVDSPLSPYPITSDTEDGVPYPKFPNPFTLPAEYVNNQESLYSKSDKFKSLDLVDFEPLKGLESENVTGVDKTEIVANKVKEDNVNGLFEDIRINQKKRETNSCESLDSNENDSCTLSNTITRTNSNNDEASDVDYTEENQNADSSFQINADETENNVNHDGSDDNDSDDDEISFYNEQKSKEKVYTCSCEQYLEEDKTQPKDIPNCLNMSFPLSENPTRSDTKEYLKIHERRQSLAKSPTGEKLENLPPWIAQMIKASTPGSVTKPKPHDREVNDDCEIMSPITAHNKEILGIVENATRYLQEQVKNRSSPASPQLYGKKPKRWKSERSSRRPPYLSRSANVEEDTKYQSHSTSVSRANSINGSLFANVTPKFKVVSNRSVDMVDNIMKQSSEKSDQNDCPYCHFDEDSTPDIVLPSVSFGEEQLKFMEIQAQVYAARQPYQEENISESVRVIDKDVPRTDRELPQFSGDDNPGLVKLRDALLTYAFFHPDVGYAQGMNDIMSRFLVVMDTESEAFWMFVNYMEYFKQDFMEEGMLKKIALVEQLLMKMDRALYDYLQAMDMGLMFCHRWLLLNFKREFDYKEAIRLFEITSSRHLEVSSVAAELERSKERAKEFLKDNRGSHSEEIYLSPEYPFDIFVCVTMLVECRHMIMETDDLSAVYQILSNLPTTLDLQNILRKSEELFYKFCRKTVVDCFQVIDEVELQDFQRKKKMFSFNFQI